MKAGGKFLFLLFSLFFLLAAADEKSQEQSPEPALVQSEEAAWAEVDERTSALSEQMIAYKRALSELKDKIASGEKTVLEELAEVDVCPAGKVASLLARAKTDIQSLQRVQALYVALRKQEAQLAALLTQRGVKIPETVAANTPITPRAKKALQKAIKKIAGKPAGALPKSATKKLAKAAKGAPVTDASSLKDVSLALKQALRRMSDFASKLDKAEAGINANAQKIKSGQATLLGQHTQLEKIEKKMGQINKQLGRLASKVAPGLKLKLPKNKKATAKKVAKPAAKSAKAGKVAKAVGKATKAAGKAVKVVGKAAKVAGKVVKVAGKVAKAAGKAVKVAGKAAKGVKKVALKGKGKGKGKKLARRVRRARAGRKLARRARARAGRKLARRGRAGRKLARRGRGRKLLRRRARAGRGRGRGRKLLRRARGRGRGRKLLRRRRGSKAAKQLKKKLRATQKKVKQLANKQKKVLKATKASAIAAARAAQAAKLAIAKAKTYARKAGKAAAAKAMKAARVAAAKAAATHKRLRKNLKKAGALKPKTKAQREKWADVVKQSRALLKRTVKIKDILNRQLAQYQDESDVEGRKYNGWASIWDYLKGIKHAKYWSERAKEIDRDVSTIMGPAEAKAAAESAFGGVARLLKAADDTHATKFTKKVGNPVLKLLMDTPSPSAFTNPPEQGAKVRILPKAEKPDETHARVSWEDLSKVPDDPNLLSPIYVSQYRKPRKNLKIKLPELPEYDPTWPYPRVPYSYPVRAVKYNPTKENPHLLSRKALTRLSDSPETWDAPANLRATPRRTRRAAPVKIVDYNPAENNEVLENSQKVEKLSKVEPEYVR